MIPIASPARAGLGERAQASNPIANPTNSKRKMGDANCVWTDRRQTIQNHACRSAISKRRQDTPSIDIGWKRLFNDDEELLSPCGSLTNVRKEGTRPQTMRPIE